MAQKPEWENFAYELYKELKGEEDFNQKMEELNKDPPPPGICSQAQMKWNVLKIHAVFGFLAFKTHKRSAHPFGFGAFGKLQIVNKPEFPEHEFLTAGRIFPCRIRHTHANTKVDDDASSEFRSVSLKLADTDDESPLDILLSTGHSTNTWDATSLFQLINSVISGDVKNYVLTSPQHLFNHIQGIRRAPDSYTDQVYHSRMVFNFKAKDGKPRYGKYRLINADSRPETGLLTEEEQRKVWEHERYPDEKRSKHYLREEYVERLSRGPIKYKLQIQLHEISPYDSQQILNLGKPWDEETHPFMDLADVTIATMLADDVVERTKYNISNCPPSLGMLGPPKTIYDYTFIPHVRVSTYKLSQQMRFLRGVRVNAENLVTYVITMETGDVKHAGTNATISITMTGSKARTGAIVLDKTFHDDFERGDVEEYRVKAMDVGDLYVIRIHNDGGGSLFKNPDWFVKKMTVLKEGNETPYEFPCQKWVSKDLTVFHGAGLRPRQNQPEIVRILHELESQEQQQEHH